MEKIVVVIALSLAIACGQAESPLPPQQAPGAVTSGQGPTIDVGAQFSPAAVTVAKGQPIRLAFRRGDQPTCGDEVVFADLGIRTKVPKNETTIVELPAQAEARTLNFTCGMNMMKGTVVVQ